MTAPQFDCVGIRLVGKAVSLAGQARAADRPLFRNCAGTPLGLDDIAARLRGLPLEKCDAHALRSIWRKSLRAR
ncbi:MAG: hypothetical protein AAB262_14845, partial [Elusimicrobiota bacterium]